MHMDRLGRSQEEGDAMMPAFTSLTLRATFNVHPPSARSALAVPKDLYVFPDFPYPEGLRPKNEYPTGQEVGAWGSPYGVWADLCRAGAECHSL